MKGIYAIIIAFLASWDTSIAEIILPVPIKCPDRETNTTTNIPHEYDCTKFYKCRLGVPYVQDCDYRKDIGGRVKLHYNIFEQVCDWPWRAGCKYCPQDGDIGRPLPVTYIPGEDNCNYIKCKKGVPSEERKCGSANTCFSRTCQTCVVSREGGHCNDESKFIFNIDNESVSNTDSDTSKYDSRYRAAHECNCGKYYEYIDDNWILEECPIGLHFNELTKTCTTPDEAKCVNKE